MNTSEFLSSNVFKTLISGTSIDTALSLTEVNGLTYSQIDFATGLFSFNTDPTTFGLKGLPIGSIVFSDGQGNQLFGTDSAIGIIDFNTLIARASGTFTVTSGEGMFSGANGMLSFSEVDTINLVPGDPFKGHALVNGSFETVPEPKFDFYVMGILGIGLLLRHVVFILISR